MSEWIELAKEFVECDDWVWMDGMKPYGGLSGKRNPAERLGYVYCDGEGYVKVIEGGGPDNFPSWGWPAKDSGWLPDLEDPATKGCILHMVREKLDLFGLSTFYHFDIRSGLMCWQVRNPIEVYGFAHRIIDAFEDVLFSKETSKVIEMEALLDALKGGPNVGELYKLNKDVEE